MPVSITPKTQTFTNGTANDAGPVDSSFVDAFNNDANLQTKVNSLLSGNIEDGTTLTLNSLYTGGTPGNLSLLLNRGSAGKVGTRWNDTTKQLEISNDGTNWYPLGVVVSADPATPAAGWAWFNTTSNRLKYYDGTTVQSVSNLNDTVRTLPKGFMGGPPITWQNATTVQIPAGFRCRDDGDIADIVFTAAQNVVVSVAGANGLDTGVVAANTWYSLWAIRNSSTGTVAGLLSASNTAPTLPTGFNQKRLIPGDWRYGASSAFWKAKMSGTYPFVEMTYFEAMPYAATGVTGALSGGTAGVWTTIALANFMSPLSQLAVIDYHYALTTGVYTSAIRTKGQTHGGWDSSTSNYSAGDKYIGPFVTDSGRNIEYQTNLAAYLNVLGYRITEYTNGL